MENGARGFSFVGREKASAKKACTGEGHRATPNGYLPTAALIRSVGNMYISPSGLWTDAKYSKIYQKQHKNLNGKIIKPYDVEWLF